MSAGEPGTTWSDRLQCWVMDPDFVPTPAHNAVARVRQATDILVWQFNPGGIERAMEDAADLIDRIHFWLTIPLIGRWIANWRLAPKLDAISDVLEKAI